VPNESVKELKAMTVECIGSSMRGELALVDGIGMWQVATRGNLIWQSSMSRGQCYPYSGAERISNAAPGNQVM
jgi:hypothetical protein